MNPNKLYLVQTDTTAGFVSMNADLLSKAKKRAPSQPFLICIDSYDKLAKLTRVPNRHKIRVRRAVNTTFLYPNKNAIRVVKEPHHARFLQAFDFLYSTSANENKKHFEIRYATESADIIIEDARGLFEGEASKILKLGKNKIRRLR